MNRRPLLLALLALPPLLATAAAADYETSGKPPGTVTVKQTSDDGTLTVSVEASVVTISDDSGGTLMPGKPKSVKVRMLGVGTDLEIDLDAPLAGNLDLRLANTPHLDFTGLSNSIGGNLKIKADEGSQFIQIAINAPLFVGKNLIVDLGEDSDSIHDTHNDIEVLGSAKLTGVNGFDINGTTTIGKNLTWNAKKESSATLLNDNETFTVMGNLKFIGGSGRDRLALNGIGAGSSIGKNLIVSLGDNPTGSPQEVFATDGCSVGGNVKVTSGQSNAGNSFYMGPTSQVGKNISVKYPGPGPGIAQFRGILDGKSVKYSGGTGIDLVMFEAVGVPAKLNAKLGAGNDTLTLDASADLKSVNVDFGAGTDTFNNPFGPNPPFKLKTKNLP
jgi:hypothetical protein